MTKRASSRPRGIDWDAQPLGEVPDSVIAARVGRGVTSVRNARWKRGIPPARRRTKSGTTQSALTSDSLDELHAWADAAGTQSRDPQKSSESEPQLSPSDTEPCDDPVDDLPKSVADIAGIIGRQKALRLVGALEPRRYTRPNGRKFVRRVLYVPRRPDGDHILVRVLGRAGASRLVRSLSGYFIHLPPCTSLVRAHRDLAICRLSRAGVPDAELVVLFELSTRQIDNILSRRPCRKA